MGNSGREGPGAVQSVDRAVAIREILARDGEAGVTEVARELDVHKSTASRLLAALDRRELVTQDTARGKFRLGVGIVRLDQAAGPAALSPHNWAGRRIPLHATSDGKVLLAYLPEAEFAAYLTPPLARFTERTVTAVAEFPAR